MWSLCESPEALVRSSTSSAIVLISGGTDWTYQIHGLCEQLLTVLVVVTAPLSLLYRFVLYILDNKYTNTCQCYILFSFQFV